MGIGRSRFLELFGGGLAAQPVDAVEFLDDLYVNHKFGMAFRKPHGWHFANVREAGKAARGQQFDGDGLDADEMFADEDSLPLVVIAEEELSASAQEFTPGINVYLREREELAFLVRAMKHLRATLPPVNNAAEELRYLRGILPQFEVLSEPSERRVSECPAAHYSFAYEFRHENLARPMRVRQQALSIIQLPAWHRIYMSDSPYSGKGRGPLILMPSLEASRWCDQLCWSNGP